MNIFVHYPHSASGRHSFVYFVFRKLNQISIQLSEDQRGREGGRRPEQKLHCRMGTIECGFLSLKSCFSKSEISPIWCSIPRTSTSSTSVRYGCGLGPWMVGGVGGEKGRWNSQWPRTNHSSVLHPSSTCTAALLDNQLLTPLLSYSSFHLFGPASELN